MKGLISVIILMFFINGCIDNNERLEKEDFSWFEYNLIKINEPNIQKSRLNRIRLIMSNPYGFPDHYLGVIEYDKFFIVYEKVDYEDEELLYESKGYKIQREEFKDSWQEMLNINMLSDTSERVDDLEFAHRPSWIFEIQNNNSYNLEEGILTFEEVALIKRLYELASIELPQLPAKFAE